MEEDLPDYTMCLPFPMLPEGLPDDFAARVQAAIAAFQEQQQAQALPKPSRPRGRSK